ncbi:MAG: PKD domain-containing protein, partial [Acidobacteria bacterium]|nr:PKD domain-containing protein [Acidobacteriota bacterium]
MQPAGNTLIVAITPNRAPTADAGPDLRAVTGTAVRLAGAGSDPDGDRLTYAWTAPAGLVLSAPNAPTPSFTPATAGTTTFRLRVTDPGGLWAEDSVAVFADTMTPDLSTALLIVRGVARLESGEYPLAGSRVQLTNARTGAVLTGQLSPESGSFTVTFQDAGGDAARSGDTLRLELLAPDGTPIQLVRPQPPSVVLADAAINEEAIFIELTGQGNLAGAAVLETLAGTGAASFGGDGGSAAAAPLNGPTDLAVDGSGNVYVADTFNNRVRRFSPGGVISTVAGNGKTELGAEGSVATETGIGYPVAVAVAPDGTLFIADRLNNRVYRVDASTHALTTLAGTGAATFDGDGPDARLASLNDPRGLALRGTSSLLVTDSRNHRVRELDLATRAIRTVAGNGTPAPASVSPDPVAAAGAVLNTPAGVAVDGQGRILVTELGGHRLRRIDPGAATIETVAGTGAFGSTGDGGAPRQAQLA